VDRTNPFWWTYGFSCVAFLLLAVVWYRSFFLDEELKSRFLGYPITYVATYYFIAQMLLFAVVLCVPDAKERLIIIANTVLLGIALIGICFTQIGKNYAFSIEEKVAEKNSFIKKQIYQLEILCSNVSNETVRNKLVSLIEEIRYSDPISDKKVEDIERKINIKIGELKYVDNIGISIDELKLLVKQRNELCKMYK
ncbi:MAG: hypothetical protein MJ048_04625, partial [Acidaminococcaceae bacterium]|nr:hypothetical protein [Acidaminococcaceae bacterium]